MIRVNYYTGHVSILPVCIYLWPTPNPSILYNLFLEHGTQAYLRFLGGAFPGISLQTTCLSALAPLYFLASGGRKWEAEEVGIWGKHCGMAAC